MANGNGPFNNRLNNSLQHAYSIGSTITLNKMNKEPEQVNKYDIPVGALVYVKTKDLYADLYSTPTWIHNLAQPVTNYPNMQTTANPVWIANNTTTTNGVTYKGSYVTTSNVKEPLEDLQELYDAYVADIQSKNGTSGNGKGGFGLGMSTMGGCKNKKKGLSSTSSSSATIKNYTYTKPVKGQISTGTGAGCMGNTINANYQANKVYVSGKVNPNVYPRLPEYQLVGYQTIQDYMNNTSPVYVTQGEGLSEEELKEAFDEKGEYPIVGKPFHGIVVDRFIPRIVTEQGETVELPNHRRLYKVLINENNCLWVDEKELSPMKPKECPLKELTNKPTTDKDAK